MSSNMYVAIKQMWQTDVDIWFLIERDWCQECCHGNCITSIVLFLFDAYLWCQLSLKNTALIFLEIFLIQYFTVLVEQVITSLPSSFA